MAFSWKLAWLALALAAVALVEQCAAQNWKHDFLRAHNAARAKVGVDPVCWDDAAAAYAWKYAQQRRRDCALVHSPKRWPHGYGENIYVGYSGQSASDAVRSWVEEKAYYHYGTNSCARWHTCGHYTQVVWRNTKAIGCARVNCDNGGIFIICSYSPPGNWANHRPY